MSFSPKFLKANVSFDLQGNTFGAGTQLISSNEILAFKWGGFDPQQMAGSPVRIKLQTHSKIPYSVECNGFIACEKTESAKDLGFSFQLDQSESQVLAAMLDAEGIQPDFVRKFPRILFSKQYGCMPSRALLHQATAQGEIHLSTDIENLSPTGISLYTEDYRAANFNPGEPFKVDLLPRGDFKNIISFEVVLKRHTHSISVESLNHFWKLGLGISLISNVQQTAFALLLKQIIQTIKNKTND